VKFRCLAVPGLLFLLASVCYGTAPFYLDSSLSTVNPVDWNGPNGSVSGSANGLTSSTSGAIIAKNDPSGPLQGPAGPYEYEIRTTYKLASSGGNYVTYFRATPNAHLNPYGASTGSFYAMELRNPQVQPSGYCETDIRVVKSINGSVTELAVGHITCWDGMVLRTVVRNSVIYIFKDQWDGCCFNIADRDLMTGRPGVGVANSPAGNGISHV
jgi:hypothetical protein